jgi:hypothetical protein
VSICRPTLDQNVDLYQCVLDLPNIDLREQALFKLSNRREEFPDMAPILWYSFGTIAALLQEIVSIYPLVSTPRLTPAVSNRCCNALALLQCVASHTETRRLFLNCMLIFDSDMWRNVLCFFCSSSIGAVSLSFLEHTVPRAPL